MNKLLKILYPEIKFSNISPNSQGQSYAPVVIFMFSLVLAALLFVFLANEAKALEAKSKYHCQGVHCETKSKVEEVKDNAELKMADLQVDQCLVDLDKQAFSRIIELDQRGQKIVYVTEDKDLNLQRTVTFYNKKDFNRGMKILPCDQTATVNISDSVRFKKCISTASKYASKYFCEKERRTNF